MPELLKLSNDCSEHSQDKWYIYSRGSELTAACVLPTLLKFSICVRRIILVPVVQELTLPSPNATPFFVLVYDSRIRPEKIVFFEGLWYNGWANTPTAEQNDSESQGGFCQRRCFLYQKIIKGPTEKFNILQQIEFYLFKSGVLLKQYRRVSLVALISQLIREWIETKLQEEAVVACFNLLYRHFPGCTKKQHEKHQDSRSLGRYCNTGRLQYEARGPSH